jgi:hypothetical protein
MIDLQQLQNSIKNMLGYEVSLYHSYVEGNFVINVERKMLTF